MLKIYINNEEVVANNDFIIKKHMLNTPSVILNNVCPKEWKENKDYSSFYHPQDYSKCKIQDETYIPAEPGTYTTINGTATIQNVSASKLQEVLQLDGNTTQETTTGKNLFKPTLQSNGTNISMTRCSVSISGDEFTFVASGTDMYFGNVIATGSNYSNALGYLMEIPSGATTIYIKSTNNVFNKNFITFYDSSKVSLGFSQITDSKAIPSGAKYFNVRIGYGDSVSGTTYKTKIMLSTTGGDYEPYTNGASPNPTYPQPVNVVSGRQEVDIYNNTNLFNIQNNITNANIDSSGTITNGTYSLYYFEVNDTKKYRMTTGSSRQWVYSFYTEIPQINSTGYSRQVHSSLVEEFSIPQGYKYVAFRRIDGGGEVITNIQINEINAYEINLGKNLYYMNYEDYTYNNFNGTNITSTHTGYSISGTATSNTTFTLVSRYITLPVGTYTMKLKKVSSMQTGLSKTNYSPVVRINAGQTSNTFTLSEETNVCLTLGIVNGTQYNEENEVMICKGTNVGDFSPYKTPIELCKIGNYQDRIYKENGTWYLHKEIGKTVITSFNSKSGTNKNYMYSTSVIDNIKRPSGGAVASSIIATHGISKAPNTMYLNDTTGVGVNIDGTIAVAFGLSSTLTTKELANTWVASNNITTYYALNTPTNTEITDSELISQLEAVKLINGLNNVSISSPYLPAPIYIHYNFVNEETIIDLLFCGVVKNSGNISLNPREPHYTSLQILDFKDFLSSGETLDYVIYQKTIREAIEQVISSISDYGFILGNLNILNENEVIGAYSTKDKTAYDVFNYIADITQSRWTTRMIDENTVAIDFYDPTLMPQGTAINYTQTFFENNLIDDIKYNYGTNNYRNKQVMVSNQVVGNLAQIQTLYSNGYQEQYIVDLPIAQIESIYVNGVKKEVATATEKELGIQADFYYSINSNVIESEITYPTSSKIEINYIPIIEGRQVITNNSEIERINNSTGRKGIISRYESRNDATTLLELQKIGESYIKYKGTPEIVLKIEARSNIWDVGQRVQFNAPIDELDTEYMVRTKQINYIVSTNTIFYTYELVSSFNSETEINYFDNQRAKSKGNIGEGEYISRNIDIENVANVIFYNTTITEITPTGDNTLNSILNSPFTS